MKILYVITRANRGGAQANVLSLALQAKAAGHEVAIATGEDGWLMHQAVPAGIRPIFFRSLRRSWNPIHSLAFIFNLRTELRWRPVDVVHLHSSNTLPGVLVVPSLYLKPRMIFTVHGLSALHPGWKGHTIAKSIYRWMMKTFLSGFDQVIFVCRHDRKFIQKTGFLPKDKGVVIPNGINPKAEITSADQARKRLFKLMGRQDKGQTLFGTIGRLDYSKRMELFLEAAEKLKYNDLLFIIGGDGPNEHQLQNLVKKLEVGPVMHFLGAVEKPEEIITAFRAFIMTSRFEGMPYVLLEAGRAEVPVIATPVGGVPELIENSTNGRLLAEDTADCLAEEMVWMSNHPNHAKEMAHALHRKVTRDFTEEKMFLQTIKQYHD